VPDPVISDLELTAWDYRVFCILARHCWKDKETKVLIPGTIRTRKIAEILGAHPKAGPVLVRRAIRHLEQRGHLRVMRRKGATSSYDLSPAWRQTENPGVLTTENPGVLTTENAKVPTQAQTENPGVLPVFPERDFHTKARRAVRGPAFMKKSPTANGEGDKPHPREGRPEIEYAFANCETRGVTRAGFLRAIRQRPELWETDINSAACRFAERHGQLRDPDAAWAAWLNTQRGLDPVNPEGNVLWGA